MENTCLELQWRDKRTTSPFKVIRHNSVVLVCIPLCHQGAHTISLDKKLNWLHLSANGWSLKIPSHFHSKVLCILTDICINFKTFEIWIKIIKKMLDDVYELLQRFWRFSTISLRQASWKFRFLWGNLYWNFATCPIRTFFQPILTGNFENSSHHIETGNFLMQNSKAIKVVYQASFARGGAALVAEPLCLEQMVKRTRDL